MYLLLGELWLDVGRTQDVFLYSSVNGDIAHIAVELQLNDRVELQSITFLNICRLVLIVYIVTC